MPSNGKRFDPIFDIISRLDWAHREFSHVSEVRDALGQLEVYQARVESMALDTEYSIPALCHGDFFRSNILCTPVGLRIIDVEFAGVGDGWFDLASISLVMEDQAIPRFIADYLGECTGDRVRALYHHRFLVAVWDATWALVHFARDQSGHDYRAHLSESIGRLGAAFQEAS